MSDRHVADVPRYLSEVATNTGLELGHAKYAVVAGYFDIKREKVVCGAEGCPEWMPIHLIVRGAWPEDHVTWFICTACGISDVWLN